MGIVGVGVIHSAVCPMLSTHDKYDFLIVKPPFGSSKYTIIKKNKADKNLLNILRDSFYYILMFSKYHIKQYFLLESFTNPNRIHLPRCI